MLRVEDEERIGSPPSACFAILTDMRRWAELDAALLAIEPMGIIESGDHGSMTHRRNGLRITTTWEVTDVEAPRRLVVVVRGRGYELVESLLLQGSADGTIVRVTDVVTPTSLPGRLLVAMSGRVMRSDLRARLERLREVVEATPMAASA